MNRTCLTVCKLNQPKLSRVWRSCGGFFDVEQNEARLKELDGQMAGDNFWDHREAAQKVVEEAARLRKRTEPFRKAESQLAD